jgi:N-acetylglucosamine-6-phosphate deacetylase
MSRVHGRLVLADRVATGTVVIEDGLIAEVDLEAESGPHVGGTGSYLAPGFVDIHVHGWGGHDAMDGPAALAGMARALLDRGVTSFLPTAVTAPLPALRQFAADVRGWLPVAARDGALPLGFNLEGPFLAAARHGAHDPTLMRAPGDVAADEIEPLLDGLRLITIAPELPGALELTARLARRGVVVSVGHSAATFDEARAGYAAGARSTTHLFNAMTGVDHRAPGVAVAALTDDEVNVELIADGHHVHEALWPVVMRLKPDGRLLLVSDAISPAGMGDGRSMIGGLEVDVVGGRVTLAGTTTLAGSAIALDTAVRNVVRSGLDLPAAVAAASRNPARLLGIVDRAEIAVGQRADLVELDPDLRVGRVMLGGTWRV